MYNAEYVTFSATINVTYTEGATCTCTLGDKVLTAPDTTGFYAFTVGATGTWTVKIEKEDEPEPKTTTVEITENGQTESVEITFIPIVPWSTGSDEDIAAMLQAHYEGKINIWDYWEIGQERVVHLNAISGSDHLSDQSEQYTTWVLMHKGQYPLADGTTAVAVVGVKTYLLEKESTGVFEFTSSGGGWSITFLKERCDEIIYPSIPESFRGIFKNMHIENARGAGDAREVTTGFLALPAEKEILGANSVANPTAESNLFQFDWYKLAENRSKGRAYWTRSNITGNPQVSYVAKSFCAIEANGESSSIYSTELLSISPFGCI